LLSMTAANALRLSIIMLNPYVNYEYNAFEASYGRA
jgi:hypothetical protein